MDHQLHGQRRHRHRREHPEVGRTAVCAPPGVAGPKILGVRPNSAAIIGEPLTAGHADWIENTIRATNKQGAFGRGERPAASISVQWEDCGSARLPQSDH